MTHLLQDSLGNRMAQWLSCYELSSTFQVLKVELFNLAGGDAKTLMFVQISPSDQDVGETLSSLNFATRVRGIELGPVRKQVDTSELQKAKAMVGIQISAKLLFSSLKN